MRELWMIMKANVKGGKSGFISIAVLMLIVSVTLTTVLTVKINSTTHVKETIKADGFGDIWAGFNNAKVEQAGTTIDALVKQIGQCEETGKVFVTDCVYVKLKEFNGRKDNGSNLIMQVNHPGGLHYQFFTKDGKDLTDEPPVLKAGEIAVPYSYKTLFDCNIGDTLYVEDRGDKRGFRVSYFFEDPFMGSSLIGVKTILCSQEDLEHMTALGVKDPFGSFSPGTIINVSKKEGISLTDTHFIRILNEKTNYTGFAFLSMSASQAINYMLILTNIFSGILVAFVILLVIVALIIIGHHINNSIEMDFVNLGIYKSIGFTDQKLRTINMSQYLLAAFLGIMIGMPISVPMIGLINEMTKPVTCLQISANIPMVWCVSILLLILLFISVFVRRKLRRISRITPIRVIRGAKDDIYFKSRLQLGIQQRGMKFFLTYRQLTSGLKQYLGAMAITAILVFFLCMVSMMVIWIGNDGKNLNKLFSAFDQDLTVNYYDESERAGVEAAIEEKSQIRAHFKITTLYMLIDDVQVYTLVCDTPEVINSVFEGRTCRYENEILVTQFLANELNVSLGDEITIKYGDDKAEFIISGYYECANDLGINFAMSAQGYQRLTGEGVKKMTDIYNLNDNSVVSGLVKELSSTYGEGSLKASEGDVFEAMGSIVTAVKSISVVIYIIAILFVLVTVYMMCGKIFAKEKKDYGIYKALGFTSSELRVQFALRFAMVAVLGSILGIILNLALSDVCGSFLFSFMGVSRAGVHVIWWINGIPMVFMILNYFVFSYLASGRIKRVETRILISD